MVFETSGPSNSIRVPRIERSIKKRDVYHEVNKDGIKLTSFEDWAKAAQAGNVGYLFVLDHESSIPDNDLDAIVSSCKDVPCGA